MLTASVATGTSAQTSCTGHSGMKPSTVCVPTEFWTCGVSMSPGQPVCRCMEATLLAP